MENLYLIKCNAHYKIGIANDLNSRVASLQTGNPYPLVVEFSFLFPNALVIERALHQAFAGSRTLGEWFELTEGEVNEIRSVCRSLGGTEVPVRKTVEPLAIEEAEEMQDAIDHPNEWDFAEMFRDGWCMDLYHNGRFGGDGERRYEYWAWRKRRSGESSYIYGGRISDLPYPNVETMRRVYRDGGKP